MPGECRASTPFFLFGQDVDARDERGHDGFHPTGVTLTETSSFWPPDAKTTPSIGATSE
jgi:hypothetical protein